MVFKFKKTSLMEQFLKKEFGEEEGLRILVRSQAKMKHLHSQSEDKSEKQSRTLVRNIFPKVGLYVVLKNDEKYADKAMEIIEKYLINTEAARIKKRWGLWEYLPGFFSVFRGIMAERATTSGSWTSDIMRSDKQALEYSVVRCLWLDACLEAMCPELCKVFCGMEKEIYNAMQTVRFSRTKTLAHGFECCDFQFFRN